MWGDVDKEKKWVIKFAAVILFITLVPYWTGFSRQGQDWVFTGFVFGVEDGNSYIAKMLSGANGSWLFRTPFTAYPQDGAFAFFPYLLLGKAASQPGVHTQLVVLFHLFRLLSGFLVILASYEFISIFIKDISLRRLGTAIVTLGGGLGWLSVVGLDWLWRDGLPLEFYSPETFGFLALLGLPHLTMARALLLWGLRAVLRTTSGESAWKPAVKAGFCWLALGLFQPLTVVVGWVVFGVYQVAMLLEQILFRKNELDLKHKTTVLMPMMIVIGISAPIPIYSFFAFSTDPFLKQWTEQNLILSPPVWEYLLAFGLMLPLAIMGIREIINNKWSKAYLVACWVVIFPFLAYAPYNLQRRLPEGVWVALVVLVFIFLESVKNQNLLKWLRRTLYLSFITTLFVFLGAVIAVWKPDYPLYRQENQVQMFKFIDGIAEDGDVVLAAYGTSNALPAWAPVRTLIGHGPESINLEVANEQVKEFYATESDTAFRENLIEEFGIRYVVWGPEEKSLGKRDLDQDHLLEKIYQMNGYSVFAVKSAER